MTNPREILQIQAGKLANFTGVHLYNSMDFLWNTPALLDHQSQRTAGTGKQKQPQEEPHSNVFYRSKASIGSRIGGGAEVEYVPRLLAIDLKGAMGSLYETGKEEEEREGGDEKKRPTSSGWDGRVQKVMLDQGQMNAYIEARQSEKLDSSSSYSNVLTESVHFWSDFTASPFYYNTAADTVVEVADYTDSDPTRLFAFYQQGREALQNIEFQALIFEDRIRKSMEECDSSQGFQVLCSADDAFSGLSANLIQDELCQEYPKKSIVVYGISGSTSTATRVARANQALLMKSMMECGVLYIPIHTPSTIDADDAESKRTWSRFLEPRFDTIYQQTGYLSAAIESLSLPFHLAASSSSSIMEMAQYQTLLSCGSETVCGVSLGFPVIEEGGSGVALDGKSVNERVEGVFGKGFEGWARDLTLETCFNIKDTQKSISVFRGVTYAIQGGSRVMESSSFKDAINQVMAALSPSAHSLIYNQPFYLSPTFPQIFGNSISRSGLKSINSRPLDQCILSTPLVATLYSGGPAIQKLYSRMLQNVTFKGNMGDGMVQRDFGGGEFGMEHGEWHEVREHFANLLIYDEDEDDT